MDFGFDFMMLIVLFFLLALGTALLLVIRLLWRKVYPEKSPANGEGQGADKKLAPPLLPAGLSSSGRQLLLRLAVVACLIFVMMPPLRLILGIVQDRASYHAEAVSTISSTWGKEQQLAGPFLIIPYTVRYQKEEKMPRSDEELLELEARGIKNPGAYRMEKMLKTEEHLAVLLPDALTVTGDLRPERRYYGIHGALLYSAQLQLEGRFSRADMASLDKREVVPHWEEAEFMVSLSEPRAFREISELQVSGRKYHFTPGTGGQVTPSGFSCPVDLSALAEQSFDFSFSMGINGSQSFFLTPLGESNSFSLTSSWPHPSFIGSGLPQQHSIDDTGFNASWSIPNLVRTYPQFAHISAFDGQKVLKDYKVGVSFVEPLNQYSLLFRAVKFGILFISLTFLAVFLLECIGREVRLHLVQYGVIGLSLSFFYLTLLAVSEHMRFAPAYLLAGVLNVLMICGYIAAALKRRRETLRAGGVLVLLYIALYVILNLEDYALLVGTLLLALALAAVMYATRSLRASAHTAAGSANGAQGRLSAERPHEQEQ
jgi:inner membrane protein